MLRENAQPMLKCQGSIHFRSDHFVRAFHDTYGMPTIVTNCSNNYGPYQFPEKLIPLFINNIRHRKPLPVYGKGENVRNWLYVAGGSLPYTQGGCVISL